ncbi:balbiani ring protein 3-like isoform X2 [Liolophura sinensis]|uniref:balbiani ring protein 3-like isoform X2 n=1 Tax=Liolophura sinensis TaxID=3198878 RepID=UPI0031590901
MRCCDILSLLFISLLLTSSQAQVPAALMKRLRQINLEEFIDEFLRMPQTDPLANNGSSCGVGEQGQECSSSGRIPPNTRSMIMSRVVQPDLCSPHLVTVDVPQHPDPNVVHYPTCILMERCTGCGGTEHEICAPVEVTFVPKVILSPSLNLDGPMDFDGSKMKTIYIEKHLRCEIRCRVQPEDCNYSIHLRYDDEICRCVCKNAHEESSCRLPRRWDEETCQCLCPTITNCDSRNSAFNTDTCRCERRSLSSASSLGLHSSADDLTSETNTDMAELDMSTVNRLRAMVDGENIDPVSTTEEVTTTEVPPSTEPATTTPVPTTAQPCAHKQCSQYWEPALLSNGACGCRPTFDIFSGFPIRKRK